MKVYARVIWHDWKNHFEFVFPRRKTEAPPRDYSLLPCPSAARTLLITLAACRRRAVPLGERGEGREVYAKMHFNYLLSARFGGT